MRNIRRRKCFTISRISIKRRPKWWEPWSKHNKKKPNLKNNNNLKKKEIELEIKCKKKCNVKIKLEWHMNKVCRIWRGRSLNLLRDWKTHRWCSRLHFNNLKTRWTKDEKKTIGKVFKFFLLRLNEKIYFLKNVDFWKENKL